MCVCIKSSVCYRGKHHLPSINTLKKASTGSSILESTSEANRDNISYLFAVTRSNGVRPSLSLAAMLADTDLNVSRYFTTATSPKIHAVCNALEPASSVSSTLHWYCSTNVRHTSDHPRRAAWCNSVEPDGRSPKLLVLLMAFGWLTLDNSCKACSLSPCAKTSKMLCSVLPIS